jgi:HlyD family secretion protein
MSNHSPTPFSASRNVIFGYFALVFLIGGFAIWASMTQIAGAIVAPGKIEVDRNRQVVQHEKGGVVAEILVDDGDTVAAGDLLIRLDPGQLDSQMIIVEGQLFELMARRGRLEAERDSLDLITFEEELIEVGMRNPDLRELMDGQQNLFQARLDSVAQKIEQLNKRIDQITSQISGIDSQENALRRQSSLINEELKNQQSLLARGLTQATTVLSLQREQARLEGQIGQLAASRAEAEERATEITIEVLTLGTTSREEAIASLRDLRYRELELVEQRNALRAEIDRLDIRAPVSGIVYDLLFQTPRSVIQGAEPLLYLVPQDRPLVIAARVAPTDIDQILVGQAVNLRMSALDQRMTPELVGEVLQVSADALDDPVSGQPYFRIEIAMNIGEVEKLGPEAVLLPGMPVEAFIRTVDRSPLAYLIKPMADYFVRAFRES